MLWVVGVSEVEVSSLLREEDSEDSLEIDPGSLSPTAVDSSLALCHSPDMDELMMNITGRAFHFCFVQCTSSHFSVTEKFVTAEAVCKVRICAHSLMIVLLLLFLVFVLLRKVDS